MQNVKQRQKRKRTRKVNVQKWRSLRHKAFVTSFDQWASSVRVAHGRQFPQGQGGGPRRGDVNLMLTRVRWGRERIGWERKSERCVCSHSPHLFPLSRTVCEPTSNASVGVNKSHNGSRRMSIENFKPYTRTQTQIYTHFESVILCVCMCVCLNWTQLTN